MSGDFGTGVLQTFQHWCQIVLGWKCLYSPCPASKGRVWQWASHCFWTNHVLEFTCLHINTFTTTRTTCSSHFSTAI